jgi:hypothetical protein
MSVAILLENGLALVAKIRSAYLDLNPITALEIADWLEEEGRVDEVLDLREAAMAWMDWDKRPDDSEKCCIARSRFRNALLDVDLAAYKSFGLPESTFRSRWGGKEKGRRRSK